MSEVQHYPCFVGGEPAEAESGALLQVENPTNEAVWATVPDCGAADAERALKSARQAQQGFPRSSVAAGCIGWPKLSRTIETISWVCWRRSKASRSPKLMAK